MAQPGPWETRMSHSSMVLTLLLSSVSIAAQANPGITSTVLIQPPSSESCPVRFSAERRSIPTMKNVRNADVPHGQGLQVNFLTLPATAILNADITVHGASARLHMIPAATAKANRDDAIETFRLTSSAEGPLLHSSIWTNKIVAVSWVELTRVEYADGTTWQASPQSRCTAAPSLMVLVDSAR